MIKLGDKRLNYVSDINDRDVQGKKVTEIPLAINREKITVLDEEVTKKYRIPDIEYKVNEMVDSNATYCSRDRMFHWVAQTVSKGEEL